MSIAEFFEPSYHSLSGKFLDYLANCDKLNPGEDATLSQRVTAFVLRRLIAFPLILCAAIDLAYWTLISVTVIVPSIVGAKDHFINLASTLSLFPRALQVLILGKIPEVNLIRSFVWGKVYSINENLQTLSYTPKNRELYVKQLKCLDKISKSGIDAFRYLAKSMWGVIDRQHGNMPWPELADFMIENSTSMTLTSEWKDRLGISMWGCVYPFKFFEKREYIVKKLLEHGAPYTTRVSAIRPIEEFHPYYRSKKSYCATSDLDKAVKYGFTEVAEMLLERDDALAPQLDLEERAARNNKLLRTAAQFQQPALLKLLLDKGADPCAQNAQNTSALDHVLQTGNSENLRILLQHGIDLNLLTGIWAFVKMFTSSDLPHGEQSEEWVNGEYCPTKIWWKILDEDTRLKCLEGIKRLMHTGVPFFERYLADENIVQIINKMKSGNRDELTKMKAEILSKVEETGDELSVNPFVNAILCFANVITNDEHINAFTQNFEYLLTKVPELATETAKIIAERTATIHDTMLQERSEFAQPLADIVSKYCYS